MPSTFVIPGVGTSTSTALTDTGLATVLQTLLMACLGIDPAQDPNAAARVRISWPSPGQPAWLISEDVAFLRVTEATEPYNAAHEVQQQAWSGYGIGEAYGAPTYGGIPEGTDGTYVESTIYTRAWDVDAIFYGPNSFDRARQVKACLYQSFVDAVLGASNLYLIPVTGTPRRAPELLDGQWWQRTDFSFRLYEQVTDTLTKLSAAEIDVYIGDSTGNTSGIVVVVPQQ